MELLQVIVGESHHSGEVTWQELEAADHIASAVKREKMNVLFSFLSPHAVWDPSSGNGAAHSGQQLI